MKELSIEEKAKAYDEALELAKDYHKQLLDEDNPEWASEIEKIFPELKESEDERIRKALIRFHKSTIDVDGIKGEDILAWLEKQGDIDKTSYEIAEKEKREFVGDGFIKCYADFQDFKERETYWLEYVGNDNYNVRSDNLLGKTYHITPCQLYTIFKKQTWLEKQGEQPQGKSALEAIKEEKVDNANKVEPKFHEGDWVVDSQGLTHQIERVVENVTTHTFGYDIVGGGYFNDDIKGVHLWTIQDAKDGDVLASEDKDKVFIYNGKLDLRGRVCAYCGIYKTYDGLRFTKCAIGNHFTYKEPYPATKKQRDLLFKKMKEVGYEWDAERKELKRIEQKQEWSEEDEDILKTCFYFFNGGKGGISDNKKERILNWLKSLRPQNQWKPSDKQLEALKEACDKHWEPDGLDQLYTLYQYLKKLRDE